MIDPIKIVVYIIMLFFFYGISFVFGIITMISFLLINLFLFSDYRGLEEDLLKTKDERTKLTSEVLNALKIIKLYAWDQFYKNKVHLTIKFIFRYSKLGRWNSGF